jgi:RNA polymerase sigma-70 factor (ECF subfamily)
VEATRLATVMDGSTELERCYRRQHDKLWRSLLLFCGDPDVASDALAEAFAQALRRGDEVRDLDRWVWKAAFAIARGELRRRSSGAALPDLPQEMPASTVDLVRALDRLSPKQRASVVLHHYAGYSTRETAAIIGSTPPAVGVHLQRARARLRDLLREDDDV